MRSGWKIYKKMDFKKIQKYDIFKDIIIFQILSFGFHVYFSAVEELLFSLVGQWALFVRFGPLLLSTRGGEIGI